MPREKEQIFMFPPPGLVPLAEPLPHLGGLRLMPFTGALPDETEPFEADGLEDAFDDDAAAQMLQRALSTDVVRKRLGGTRSATIGVSRYGERSKDERRWFLAVAYDYISNVVVEIRMNEDGEVTDVADVAYQPPASRTELDHAVDLARADGRFDGVDLGTFDAHTIQLDADERTGVDRNARIVEVLFACRHERLPRYRASVDLSTDRVIRAGRSETCCDCHDREEDR